MVDLTMYTDLVTIAAIDPAIKRQGVLRNLVWQNPIRPNANNHKSKQYSFHTLNDITSDTPFFLDDFTSLQKLPKMAAVSRNYDIWHEIVDYLENDRTSLLALCLVDTAMYDVASRFLWRNVNLRTKSSQPSRFSCAVRVLMDRRRHHASSVRSLRISSSTTSKFGSRGSSQTISPGGIVPGGFDGASAGYLADLCNRFRQSVTDVLPRLVNLQSFEWSSTVHLDQAILIALQQHQKVNKLDLCPGSDQSWYSSTPASDCSLISLPMLSMPRLTSLTLTLPNIFSSKCWLFEPYMEISNICSDLTLLLRNTPSIKVLSLRMRPVHDPLEAIPPMMLSMNGFHAASAVKSQRDFETELLHEIHKLLDLHHDDFCFRVTGLNSEGMWEFFEKRGTLPRVKSLTILDSPSNGKFNKYSTLKNLDPGSVRSDFMSGEKVLYDYEYRSGGKLVIRDCSALQLALLKKYRKELVELDVEFPNIDIKLVTLPNLRRLRTGICTTPGIEWTLDSINEIPKRCKQLTTMELSVPWDWKYWRQCWRKRNDPTFEGLLNGFGALKSLHISVARPFEYVNAMSVPLDTVTTLTKTQAMRHKDILPSSDFLPWLLSIYPSMDVFQVGCKTRGHRARFHQGVRSDRQRLADAIDSFETSHTPNSWHPIPSVFL